jgi:hypothetical protein
VEPREAQEIIRMVESSWLCDFGPAGRELWRQMLEPYDAELATRAVAEMARHPLPGNRARPTVADLRAVIVRLARTEHELEGWRELPPSPLPKPEWVSRWTRARAAGDRRMFPEQVPGALAIQRDDPRNLLAYAFPEGPESDPAHWVQEHEYAEERS